MKLDLALLTGHHETMIHLPFAGSMSLLDQMYRLKMLDAFYITLRPPLTTCTVVDNGVVKIPQQVCWVFEFVGGRNQQPVIDLWAFFLDHGASVTWKKDETGYQIGPGLEVVSSWALDDGC
jgi:hypothetical protein